MLPATTTHAGPLQNLKPALALKLGVWWSIPFSDTWVGLVVALARTLSRQSLNQRISQWNPAIITLLFA